MLISVHLYNYLAMFLALEDESLTCALRSVETRMELRFGPGGWLLSEQHCSTSSWIV